MAALSRADRIFLRIVHGVGIATPWLIGIGTKLILDLRGEPTLGWRYFLDPVTILGILWAGVWFYSPFGILAWSGRRVLDGGWNPARRFSRPEWRIILYAAFGVGFGGAIVIFLEMFREFDPLALLFAFTFLPFLGGWMALGVACGVGVVGLRRLRAGRINARGGPPASRERG